MTALGQVFTGTVRLSFKPNRSSNFFLADLAEWNFSAVLGRTAAAGSGARGATADRDEPLIFEAFEQARTLPGRAPPRSLTMRVG